MQLALAIVRHARSASLPRRLPRPGAGQLETRHLVAYERRRGSGLRGHRACYQASTARVFSNQSRAHNDCFSVRAVRRPRGAGASGRARCQRWAYGSYNGDLSLSPQHQCAAGESTACGAVGHGGCFQPCPPGIARGTDNAGDGDPGETHGDEHGGGAQGSSVVGLSGGTGRRLSRLRDRIPLFSKTESQAVALPLV